MSDFEWAQQSEVTGSRSIEVLPGKDAFVV